MDEELKRKIAEILSRVQYASTDQRSLSVSTDFAAFPSDVKSLKICFTGTDPLTGDDVKFHMLFDRAVTTVQTDLRYYGDLWISFVVTLRNGTTVTDLIPKQRIEFNSPTKKPEISYTLTVANGFTRLCIKSNCWRRLGGKLYLSYDGRCHAVYPDGREYTAYVPTENGIKLVVDQRLPRPVRKDG